MQKETDRQKGRKERTRENAFLGRGDGEREGKRLKEVDSSPRRPGFE